MAQFTVESLPDQFTVESLPEAAGEPGIMGTIADAAKAAGAGVVRGAVMVPGFVGDVGAGVDWVAEKIARKIFGDAQVDKVKEERAKDPGWFDRNVPTSASLNRAARALVPGADYDPKTTVGKYARTIAEFAPSAAAGGGGVVRNLAQYAVGAGIASEAAGQATEGTAYEPYARAAGAIAGGVAPSAVNAALPGSRTAEKMVRDALAGYTPDQIRAAGEVITRAQGQGITLTWPEALAQVRGDTGNSMTALQRVVESEPAGRQVLDPILNQRPAQIEAAVTGQLDAVAPVPVNPSMTGPRARDAAGAEIDRVRREEVNAPTRPGYDAARVDRVDAGTMAQLEQLPGWEQAFNTVRGNPQLNRDIATLPDNSAVVVDAVRKELDRLSTQAASPLDPGANQTVASGFRRDAAEVRNAATSASYNLADAIRDNARLRAERLTPLQEGQLGGIASAANTQAAGERLLPGQPLPGAAPETGRTIAQLERQDPGAAAELVRTRLESQFNKSAKDVQTGDNQYGGANFRRDVYGSPALRENVTAALEGLPNGQNIARGFDELMTTLEATGKRERQGSPTAGNTDIRKQLETGSATVDTLTGAGGGRWLSGLTDRVKQWTRGNNTEELARFITNPGNQGRLIELSRANLSVERRAALQAQLASNLINRDYQEERATPRDELIRAMMGKQE
jgi:hypothetical protein